MSNKQSDQRWRDASLAALRLEVDAKTTTDPAEAAVKLEKAAAIRKFAQEVLTMPGEDVTEVTGGLIRGMAGAVDEHLRALAALADSGDTEEYKSQERTRLADSAQRARQEALGREVDMIEATMDQARKVRYNAPRDADKDRSQDLADAEILSRMRRGPEELEAEARGYLAAGNPRGAMIRLDALALMGVQPRPEQLLAWRELRVAVDAALDEAVPHRKQALALENAAHEAVRQFAIAEATARAKIEMALGRPEAAAAASISAKMKAFEVGEGSQAEVVGMSSKGRA